jgi:amino acid transporter
VKDRIAEDRADDQDLSQFGYAPQLQRSMGAFSSFAVSFSLISVITGIFAGFSHGVGSFGTAVVWSWAVVLVGQFAVALVIADLAARIPLSGYGYQWASRLVNPHYGYFVGWLLLLQFMTGFPGVCTALGNELCGYFGFEAAMRPWVAVAVVGAIALVHLSGIRWAAVLNDVGVSAEIVGCLAITLLLTVAAFHSPVQGPGVLFDRTAGDGLPAGLMGFSASLLMGAWCLTGFEAAADLAEETRRPRQTVPLAVVLSESSSGIVGFLLLAALVFSIADLSSVQASDRPIQMILEQRAGPTISSVMMFVVFASIFACGLASMAASTRLLFSLARDNMLPLSSVLRKIDPTRRTPRGATVLVWLLSSAVVVGLRNIETITSVSVAAGYLGYGGILAAVLLAGPKLPPSHAGAFSLGRWRRGCAAAAIVWLFAVVASLAAADWNGPANFLATRTTTAALGVGLVVYAAVVRPRLRGGRAGPPPSS